MLARGNGTVEPGGEIAKPSGIDRTAVHVTFSLAEQLRPKCVKQWNTPWFGGREPTAGCQHAAQFSACHGVIHVMEGAPAEDRVDRTGWQGKSLSCAEDWDEPV